MREEACVLYGQHGILHHLGNLLDGGEAAALFAKFANHHPVGGINAQRQLGPVVGQIGNIRQIGLSDRQGHGHKQQEAGNTRQRQTGAP